MNAREFLTKHGRPDGDDAHEPWSPADFEVFDHLNATDVDEARLAAARIPHANSPAPAAAVRSTT